MDSVKNKKVATIGGRGLVIAIYDIVGIVVGALIILSLLAAYFLRIVGVDGPSMLPTLNNGDYILMTNAVSEYKRGDIVVIDRYTDTPMIKRIIAVGGDVINIVETEMAIRCW